MIRYNKFLNNPKFVYIVLICINEHRINCEGCDTLMVFLSHTDKTAELIYQYVPLQLKHACPLINTIHWNQLVMCN